MKIVVTGSRLRSSTYTASLQIIDAEFQREVGLINADEILQNSTNAGGQQIDLSFNGFVLDNGPGSSTVSLRGLGQPDTATDERSSIGAERRRGHPHPLA